MAPRRVNLRKFHDAREDRQPDNVLSRAVRIAETKGKSGHGKDRRVFEIMQQKGDRRNSDGDTIDSTAMTTMQNHPGQLE